MHIGARITRYTPSTVRWRELLWVFDEVVLSAVGVEPTSANTVELESTPLDHSGTLTRSDILHCHKIVQKQDHNRYHLTEPKLHQIQRPCLKTASLSLACTYFSTVYVCNNLVLLTGSFPQL